MLIRTQFPDLFLTSLLPALDEVIFGRYEQFPPQFSKIFRMMTSNRSIEQTSEIAGLGTFGQIAEGKNVRFDGAVPGFNKTYTHAQYGLGYKITRIMIDDDKWGLVNKLSSDLGKSARETREIIAASIFNNGFDGTNYAGPDGKALFATDHPIVKTGETQGNTPSVATDLDLPSIELGLTTFRKMKDQSGKKIRLKPARLVVSAEQEFIASQLMNTAKLPGNNYNDVNPIMNRSGLPSFDELMVWDYLSDPDAWFICAEPDETELRWYDREKFSTVHDVDFESRSVKTAGWMRFSVGFSSYYGVYGSPGA